MVAAKLSGGALRDIDLLSKLAEAIVKGNLENSRELVERALKEGVRADAIVMEGIARGVATVSKRYGSYEVGLVEVYEAVEAVDAAFRVLEPVSKGGAVKPLGRVVIGVIEGDIHDIGKNVVASLLRGSGFEVKDLGRDVPVARFVEEAVHHGAEIIALSTMMTTTMPNMGRVIEELKRRGLRKRFKVLVGGRPVTQKVADAIGADGYGKDGYEAVRRAIELLAE